MMDRHWSIQDVERFADGESSQADDHLRECAHCANAVLAAVQMKRAVRDVMHADGAPPALLRRVTRQVSDRYSAAQWWIGVAAAILAVVIGSALLWHEESQRELAELVDMHVTLLASANPVDVVSTDHHTVKPWFEGRVPFAVPVPDLSSTPFRLIGGRVVYWRGNPAAYLLIGKSAHRVSVFVPRQDSGPKSLAKSPPAMSTLSWQAGGLRFVAVGEIPRTDLEQLRTAFTHP